MSSPPPRAIRGFDPFIRYRATLDSFQLTPGNQIRFAMTIDGQQVSAILDTGVSFTLLSQSSPVAAKAKVRPGGQASAIGGRWPSGGCRRAACRWAG